jgi:hypothetical protein
MLTKEEVTEALQTTVNAAHRLPSSDEKRTILDRVEKLYAEVKGYDEPRQAGFEKKASFQKQGDAEPATVVKTGDAAVNAAIDKKVADLAKELDETDTKEEVK